MMAKLSDQLFEALDPARHKGFIDGKLTPRAIELLKDLPLPAHKWQKYSPALIDDLTRRPRQLATISSMGKELIRTVWGGRALGGGKYAESLDEAFEQAISESEVYVDKDGYAHDDEGNRWFVGNKRAPGTYRSGQVPMPSKDRDQDRHGAGKKRFRSSVRTPLAGQESSGDKSKRVEAFAKLPERQRSGEFAQSILSQIKAGRSLTAPQLKAVRQMFYRSRLRDLAGLFK